MLSLPLMLNETMPEPVMAPLPVLLMAPPAFRVNAVPLGVLRALLRVNAPEAVPSMALRPILMPPVLASFEKSVVEIPSVPAVSVPRSIARPAL